MTLFRASVFGLLIGVVGVLVSLMPIALSLEEDVGLSWLFTLRGLEEPPSEVAIVSIDKASAETLQLPDEPDRWPRSLHGQLIQVLHRNGARVIAFDMLFDQLRVAEDNHAMAQAMIGTRNVVLSESIKPRIINSSIYIETLISPTPELAASAIASAPFPLPKTDANIKQFWTFKASIGGRATLPTTVFQLFVFDQLYDQILQLIKLASPTRTAQLPPRKNAILQNRDVHRVIDTLKTWSTTEPALLQRLRNALNNRQNRSNLSDHEVALLSSLLNLYQAGNSHYFNHFGPSRTITTVPYHQVINQSFRDDTIFNGKAVFVGRSEDLQPESDRGFYTVFSEREAINISSVELAATAFANLLTDRVLRPLAPGDQLILIMLWGTIIGLICYVLPVRFAALSAVAVAAIYLYVVCLQFRLNHIWLPVVIPLSVQFPVALLSSLLFRYATSNRERKNIHQVLSHHIPQNVVSKLAKERYPRELSEDSELMYGVCLATDAGNYTALAETIDPMTLGQIMNAYYSAIFEPVRRHGGIVSDVVGDAMLAIWATPRVDETTRAHSCEAALELISAVDRFNQSTALRFNQSNALCLPTRIGLHYGQMRLGHVGSSNHYEYRAVGDIVNSATRIEGLNKQLGTRVLMSEDCVTPAADFYTRKLGTFLLEGKSQTLVVHELLCRSTDVRPEQEQLCAKFSEALELFQAQRWDDALAEFSRLMLDYPGDGPSVFYMRQCQKYMQYPNERAPAGVININKNAPKLAM